MSVILNLPNEVCSVSTNIQFYSLWEMNAIFRWGTNLSYSVPLQRKMSFEEQNDRNMFHNGGKMSFGAQNGHISFPKEGIRKVWA